MAWMCLYLAQLVDLKLNSSEHLQHGQALNIFFKFDVHVFYIESPHT